jgi:hypothetical protein
MCWGSVSPGFQQNIKNSTCFLIAKGEELLPHEVKIYYNWEFGIRSLSTMTLKPKFWGQIDIKWAVPLNLAKLKQNKKNWVFDILQSDLIHLIFYFLVLLGFIFAKVIGEKW